MHLPTNTTTHLRRYNNAIYSIKELISAYKIDGYEHMIDTLMMAYYGIDNIIEKLEERESEEQIKHHYKHNR